MLAPQDLRPAQIAGDEDVNAPQVAQLSIDLAVARAERDEAREALDAIPATSGDVAATVKGEED